MLCNVTLPVNLYFLLSKSIWPGWKIFQLGYMDLDGEKYRPAGSVTLHNIKRVRFLPPIKIINICNEQHPKIGYSSLISRAMDRKYRGWGYKSPV